MHHSNGSKGKRFILAQFQYMVSCLQSRNGTVGGHGGRKGLTPRQPENRERKADPVSRIYHQVTDSGPALPPNSRFSYWTDGWINQLMTILSAWSSYLPNTQAFLIILDLNFSSNQELWTSNEVECPGSVCQTEETPAAVDLSSPHTALSLWGGSKLTLQLKSTVLKNFM